MPYPLYLGTQLQPLPYRHITVDKALILQTLVYDPSQMAWYEPLQGAVQPCFIHHPIKGPYQDANQR